MDILGIEGERPAKEPLAQFDAEVSLVLRSKPQAK